MRWMLRVLGASLLVALVAQPAGAVVVNYTITNADGFAVPNTVITFTNKGDSNARLIRTRTDDEGRIDVDTIPPGKYRMRVHQDEGGSPLAHADIEIRGSGSNKTMVSLDEFRATVDQNENKVEMKDLEETQEGGGDGGDGDGGSN